VTVSPPPVPTPWPPLRPLAIGSCILPRLPKPDPGQAGGRCHPAVPLPRPLPPTQHPGEPPSRVARWLWLRARGGCAGGFSGWGHRTAMPVVAADDAPAGPVGDSGRRWRMKRCWRGQDVAACVVFPPSTALPTSCLSNRNREKRRAAPSASRRRSVGRSKAFALTQSRFSPSFDRR